MKKQIKILLLVTAVAVLIAHLLIFASAITSHAQGIVNPIDTSKPLSSVLPTYNAGVDESIRDYLCTPEGKGTDLFNCVNRLYRFGITAGAIAVVFFIVLAGYIYITGGEAQKSKAKSIIFSSLTGMGIILGSFVLLNFINPNLVVIKSIQPPIFSSSGLPKCEEIGFSANCIISTGPSSGQIVSGPSNGGGIVGGYNIGAYATDPNHEAAINKIYNSLKSVDVSTAAAITAYMKKYYPSTPLTGEMVVNSSNTYKVDVRMILAMMQQDSSYGTAGKGARTHNPGNVGNDDTGKLVDYGTWPAGVDAVAKWLLKHKVS